MIFEPWSLDAAAAALATTCNKPGPILISLQVLQERFGYVPSQAVEMVAKACNVSRADVHGVLTFYHDLRTTPPPAMTLRVCVAEACQSVGSRELVGEIEKAFNIEMGAVNDEVELQPVYCFGNCALGPSATVNGQLLGRATLQSMKQCARESVKS